MTEYRNKSAGILNVEMCEHFGEEYWVGDGCRQKVIAKIKELDILEDVLDMLVDKYCSHRDLCRALLEVINRPLEKCEHNVHLCSECHPPTL